MSTNWGPETTVSLRASALLMKYSPAWRDSGLQVSCTVCGRYVMTTSNPSSKTGLTVATGTDVTVRTCQGFKALPREGGALPDGLQALSAGQLLPARHLHALPAGHGRLPEPRRRLHRRAWGHRRRHRHRRLHRGRRRGCRNRRRRLLLRRRRRRRCCHLSLQSVGMIIKFSNNAPLICAEHGAQGKNIFAFIYTADILRSWCQTNSQKLPDWR